jgi:hypothetical protein
MKKSLILLVAALLVCGVAFAATPANQISPGAGDIVAKHGSDMIPDKTFRLVRYMPSVLGNLNVATLTKDSIVIWDIASDDGVTITTTLTSNDPAVAGIVPIAILTPETFGQTLTEDLGRRNWGWVQTYGKSNVNMMTLGTAAAGACLGTGSDRGQAAAFIASTTPGSTNGSAGFYFDAGTAAATGVECFLKVQ